MLIELYVRFFIFKVEVNHRFMDSLEVDHKQHRQLKQTPTFSDIICTLCTVSYRVTEWLPIGK